MRPRASRGMMFLGMVVACAAGAAPAAAQSPAGAESDAGEQAKPEAGPAPPAVRADAKQRHNEALASFRAGQLKEAYRGFMEAWELQGLPRIPRIAGNLGRAELKIGKHRDAAEHLAFFLREEKDLSEEDRTEFARQLAEAKAKVGTLRVEVLHPGAQVFVDGRSVGTAPMEAELYVEPGHRKVEAKHGELRAVQEVDVPAGATEMVQLDLAPPRTPPGQPSSPSGAPPARSKVPGLVLGSVGVLGLGAGLGTFILHMDERGQAQALHDGIRKDGGHCRVGPSAHASCAALQGLARDADMLRDVGTALLVGGGVFTLAGGSLLVWAGLGPKTPTDNVRLSVIPLAGGGALSLSGDL